MFIPCGNIFFSSSSSSVMCLNFFNPVLMSGNVSSKFVTKRYFSIGDFLFFLILFSRISFLLYLTAKFMSFLSTFSSSYPDLIRYALYSIRASLNMTSFLILSEQCALQRFFGSNSISISNSIYIYKTSYTAGGKCNTKYTIYAAGCTKYTLLYIGQSSQKLNCRFNGHRSDVRVKPKACELTQHFSQSKNCKIDNDLRVYILQDNLEDS